MVRRGGEKSAKCIHGGAAFVVPIVQGYSFMSLKPLHFGDIETAERILLAETPKEAKTLGREVRNFDEKSWNEVKIQKMYLALEGKFSQNKDLMDKLKDPALNGKFFVEASPFDRVWGIGYDQDHASKPIKLGRKSTW